MQEIVDAIYVNFGRIQVQFKDWANAVHTAIFDDLTDIAMEYGDEASEMVEDYLCVTI